MTIEFSCQYCQAMIRVPDKAAGGKGRCPQCAMRITVPKKSSRPPSTPIVVNSIPESPAQLIPEPGVDDEPVILLAAVEDLPVEIGADETVSEAPAPLPNEPPAVFDFTSHRAIRSEPGVLPVDTGKSRPSSTARLKRRKPLMSVWMVMGGMGLIAAVAGFFLVPGLNQETQVDVLTAYREEFPNLDPVVVPKSELKLPPAVVDELLLKLQQRPVPLFSQMMHVELSGNASGLTVTLSAGDQGQYFRVNLQNVESLRRFVSEHQQTLDEDRLRELTQSGTAFLETFQRVLNKDLPTDSVTAFRDSFALPALTGALGNQLVAQHGRGLYRCCYEDREGNVYFLLPRETTEFVITGRVQKEGKPSLSNRFQVRVKREPARTEAASEQMSTPSRVESQGENHNESYRRSVESR